MVHPNRRELIQSAALGAVGLGSVAPSLSHAHATEASAKPGAKKSKVRIGIGIGTPWLQSNNDEDLRFIKQIGVDYVNIRLPMVEGYRERGCFTKDTFQRFIDRLAAVGLRIERANSYGQYSLNAHLNRPGGQAEIDNLKRIGEILAETEIPVFGIQSCQAKLHTQDQPGWDRKKKGRGGYNYREFDLARSEKLAGPPGYRVTSDDLWKGILNIYRQVIPVIDGSKTRVAMHGNDPPLYEYLGNSQILCRFSDFDRLFSEVPSANSGITFCVGTRYESGEDVFAGIRHFAQQGKLFHVHFRNVRGTLPANHGYAEVFVDEGDLAMGEVLRTLVDVGYDGVIDYDHAMGISGDHRLRKQYIAYAVGYMRGLLHNL